MDKKLKVLFICTSNQDRSVSLENYFRDNYPQHDYRSAGVNKYFTSKKGTHYLTAEDIEWAELIVYAEEIHYVVANRDFTATGVWLKDSLNLNLGEYKQGQIGEDYLLKAESKLKNYI